MALTRRFLKGMGLTEEQVDTIIEAHTEVTETLKKERDGYKEDADKLEVVQKELDGLKAKGDDSYKEKYEAEKKAHDELKANIANEKAYASKEAAYRELLKAAGVKEKFIDTIIRADKSVIEAIKMKDDGKIENADDLTAKAKQNWSDFVATTTTKTAGVETPPTNNGSAKLTKEQIYKKDDRGHYVMSTEERQKAISEILNERN